MNEQELLAYNLGWDFQQAGGVSVPVKDADFMRVLARFSNDTLGMLRAWNRGWHAANLS